jgi:hypothetical protein
MQRMSAIYLCLAVVASGLAGCAPPLYQTASWDSGQPPHYSVYWGTFPEQPPDYSPDYTSVPVVGPNGKTRWVLVPKACLVPDATEPPFLGPHLPPGCANTYNLQRMAERKSDLVHGRPLGAAPAAPTARAAQEYIYGTKGTLGGGLPRAPGTVPPGPGPQSETEKPPATR